MELYESNDAKVGAITTLEKPGTVIRVNLKGYVPGMAKGNMLVVCVDAGREGKLIKSTQPATAGTYEVVARCREIDNVNEILTFVIVSPKYVTVP
jgi:hypothetical protein